MSACCLSEAEFILAVNSFEEVEILPVTLSHSKKGGKTKVCNFAVLKGVVMLRSGVLIILPLLWFGLLFAFAFVFTCTFTFTYTLTSTFTFTSIFTFTFICLEVLLSFSIQI